MLDCFSIYSLLFIVFVILEVSSEKRVRLYEEWVDPIEHVTSTNELFDLIPPNDPNNDGTQYAVLLYIYEDDCSDGLTNPLFIGAHYQTGPGLVLLSTLNKKIYPNIENHWNLPQNCSHFIWIPANKYFDDWSEFNRLPDQSLPIFSRWMNENRRVNVDFRNDLNEDIDFYWYEKDPVFLGTMKPGQVRNENTFLGHIFLAKKSSNGAIIDAWNAERPSQVSIRERVGWCSSQGIPEGSFECNDAIEKDIVNWTYDFWARKREALNYVQPKILSNFTRMGFRKSHLPNEIYEKILNFWNSQNNDASLVKEHYAGPVLNQYTSPTYMAHLRENERQILIDYFRNELSKWSNVPANIMDMTSLYGIRKYTYGAILGMHVDTCRTHVISAIINVDSRLTPNGRGWPLQIYDHEDNLHYITMEPGDTVFYESAKCGHARFEPLDGEWYANIFIHYAPTDANLWDCSWF